MIAKSDIVILLLSSGALALGIYRWHQETQDVSAITIPASSRTVTVGSNDVASVNDSTSQEAVLTSATNSSIESTGSSASGSTTIVQTIETPEATPEIVVTTAESTPAFGTHIVQSGDYLGRIAQQYGTDVDTLRDINGISGTIIQVGQEILYPL